MSRVFLAAYADRMAGCSNLLAAETAEKRREKSRKVSVRLEHELAETLDSWVADLKERAGLARLLEDQLGWHCKMDEEMVGAVETVLPVSLSSLSLIGRYCAFLTRTLKVFDVRLEEYAGLESAEEELEDHIEYRKAQVVFAKRDAEASLKAVRRRLGRDEHDFGFMSSLGTMEFRGFIGTKK